MIKAKRNFALRVAKCITKNNILEYFLKIPSEMNSTHPFYTIFIPMTLHAKIFTMFVGGPQGAQNPKKKIYDI